uniref:Coiled-coil domain-containing protein 153 n=1 Tax=Syphacia muris TaxID=451379 RepID=A0A0N5AC89_9BILA
MNTRAKKTAKLEKRVKIKLAGYQNIAQNLKKALNEVRTEMDVCVRERNTFILLKEREAAAINKRLSKLTEEVDQQVKRESELQAVYGKLLHDKWEIDQSFLRESATIAAQPVSYQ